MFEVQQPETSIMNRTSTITLRTEAFALGAAATALYAFTDASWLLYGGLLLVPDLTMAGYAIGPRAGAAIYNAGHSTIGPALLAALSWWFATPLALAVALIWIAHIGFDRALGYGLKQPEGFRHTHLGMVGRGGPTEGQPAADHLRKQST